MSSRYPLTAQEIANLEVAHRQTKNKRYADRLKTVYLPGKGWSVTQVAEALMMDRETVRNHYKRYLKGACLRYRSLRLAVASLFCMSCRNKH